MTLLRERLFAQETLCTVLARVPVKPGGKSAAQELDSREAAHSKALQAITANQVLARLGQTAPPPAIHDAPFSEWSAAARDLHAARLVRDSIQAQVITLEHNIELVQSGLIDKSRIFEGL
ncbi:MAG: hypothetical protein V4669_04295 [Pseudomonadota bacterium]